MESGMQCTCASAGELLQHPTTCLESAPALPLENFCSTLQQTWRSGISNSISSLTEGGESAEGRVAESLEFSTRVLEIAIKPVHRCHSSGGRVSIPGEAAQRETVGCQMRQLEDLECQMQQLEDLGPEDSQLLSIECS